MSTISNLIFNNQPHYVTSSYGARATITTSSGTTSSFHNGTDYGTNSKKLPQYAIEDGYVFAAQKASDGAKYVWVIYPRIKKAFLHYHLDSISVKAGQTVKKDTKLGTTGKTGKATGIHLHLGIRDLAKLSSSQINKITWDLLRSCPYVNPENVKYTAPTTVSFTGYVTADTLNVRSGAGTSYTVIGTLSKGKAVTVTGQSGDWYKISYNGKTAYVSKKYINKTKPATGTTTTKYYSRYTGKSTKIDDVFKAIGVPKTYCGSWSKRKPIAKKNGISNYIGTSKQNMNLITLAKQGRLIKP